MRLVFVLALLCGCATIESAWRSTMKAGGGGTKVSGVNANSRKERAWREKRETERQTEDAAAPE